MRGIKSCKYQCVQNLDIMEQHLSNHTIINSWTKLWTFVTT